MSVAIIIPCYRHAHYLPAAIESALEQSERPSEVIVVDDASDDDTARVAADYSQVSYLRRHFNGGLAAARNSGLAAATSDKVIFLDADDLLLPDAIKLGRDCFDQHPDAAFVYGAFDHVEGAVRTPRFTPAASHRDLIRCNWVASIASAMFDRKKVMRYGGFDESLGMCEDWDLFLRLSRECPFASHPGKVALYVRHATNMSNDVVQLKHWIDVVRDKERERGLDAEQQAAWDEGRDVWASFYPERSRGGRFGDALKRLSRSVPRPSLRR